MRVFLLIVCCYCSYFVYCCFLLYLSILTFIFISIWSLAYFGLWKQWYLNLMDFGSWLDLFYLYFFILDEKLLVFYRLLPCKLFVYCYLDDYAMLVLMVFYFFYLCFVLVILLILLVWDWVDFQDGWISSFILIGFGYFFV